MLKSTLVALTLALSGASATRNMSFCYQDNCNRAILGTGFGQARADARLADCRINNVCAVTPSATVTTSTTTITQGVVTITLPKVTDTPTATDAITSCNTATPTYASVCSGVPEYPGFSAYASACACGGATAVTNTAIQPTKTAVVTVTAPAQVIFV